MAEFIPRAIAQRARALIEREDGGSVERAASRAGLAPAALAALLEGVRPTINLDTLHALLNAYRADAMWLLVGERELAGARLSADERIRISHVLSGLSARIFEQHRRRSG
jgi:hypothetical protein